MASEARERNLETACARVRQAADFRDAPEYGGIKITGATLGTDADGDVFESDKSALVAENFPRYLSLQDLAATLLATESVHHLVRFNLVRSND